jgi:hypothetical protein
LHFISKMAIKLLRSLGRQPSLSEHLPILLHLLLGRAPIRRLAQSLITILLLISPLSFSTDKIRNFTYECPVSVCCDLKESRKVAIQRRAANHDPVTRVLADARFAPPAPHHPPIVRICTATHSRAPPAA